MSEHLDILVKARALIAERKNWTQNATARNAIGGHTEIHSDEAASFCLYGALMRAAGWGRRNEVWPLIAGIAAINNLEARGFPADFNDHHEHAEVLAVVDKTIASVRASRTLPSLLDIPASPTRVNETV